MEIEQPSARGLGVGSTSTNPQINPSLILKTNKPKMSYTSYLLPWSNHLKTQWFKTAINISYLTLSVGQEFRSHLVWLLGLGVSWEIVMMFAGSVFLRSLTVTGIYTSKVAYSQGWQVDYCCCSVSPYVGFSTELLGCSYDMPLTSPQKSNMRWKESQIEANLVMTQAQH